jgi:BirA family biotin operon repressor/biotin-[acetyl-CoA-carboxylase] ligase
VASSELQDFRPAPGCSLGRPFHFFASCGSTNQEALRLAAQGSPEGTLVLTEIQSQGRGRLGRTWLSQEGQSLCFSVLLRPPLHPSLASQATLLFAVAAARVLRDLAGLPAEIKWPNDVLVRGRKVCGILLEMQGQADRCDFLVVGMGINVGQEGSWFGSQSLASSATSLRAEGSSVSRLALLGALLAEADGLYQALLKEGFGAVLQPWQTLSCMTGRQVRVFLGGARGQGNRSFEGMAVGLDPDGALQVRTDNGVVERVVSGEVSLI